MDDVLINKVAQIERCLHRIEEVYQKDAANLVDYTKQDSIILNLQRAIEAAIDSAMRIVRIKKLGIPQTSRDAFSMLKDAKMLREGLGINLMSMVGFRNIAVHDYQNLNLGILKEIIEVRLIDIKEFVEWIKMQMI